MKNVQYNVINLLRLNLYNIIIVSQLTLALYFAPVYAYVCMYIGMYVCVCIHFYICQPEAYRDTWAGKALARVNMIDHVSEAKH